MTTWGDHELSGQAGQPTNAAPQVYHQWMEDPEIREATASERLSLQVCHNSKSVAELPFAMLAEIFHIAYCRRSMRCRLHGQRTRTVSLCLPHCFMALTINRVCPALTVMFCGAQPELTFILIDLQRAAQAPEDIGALCTGRWPRLLTVWLTAPTGSAVRPVLVVLQACVVMSTYF